MNIFVDLVWVLLLLVFDTKHDVHRFTLYLNSLEIMMVESFPLKTFLAESEVLWFLRNE